MVNNFNSNFLIDYIKYSEIFADEQYNVGDGINGLKAEDVKPRTNFHYGIPPDSTTLAYDPVQRILAISTRWRRGVSLFSRRLPTTFFARSTSSCLLRCFLMFVGMESSSCSAKTTLKLCSSRRPPSPPSSCRFLLLSFLTCILS